MANSLKEWQVKTLPICISKRWLLQSCQVTQISDKVIICRCTTPINKQWFSTRYNNNIRRALSNRQPPWRTTSFQEGQSATRKATEGRAASNSHTASRWILIIPCSNTGAFWPAMRPLPWASYRGLPIIHFLLRIMGALNNHRFVAWL